MHFTSARNAELIGGVTVGNAKRNVLEQLAVKSVAQLTRGNKLALFACQGAVVDHKGHFHGRLGDLNKLQRLGLGNGSQCVTNGDVARTREAYNVANGGFLYGLTNKTVDLVQRYHLGLFNSTGGVIVADCNLLTYANVAALDASDTDTSNVIVVVDRGNEQLKVACFVSLGSRHIIYNLLEQRCQVNALFEGILGSGTRSARAVHHRAVELFVVCAEVHEELKNFIFNLTKTCVGLVYFVDANNNAMIEFQCLLQNETCLRHRALGSVNQKDNTVYHLQDSLNLATKVGVAGGIDDVDFNILVVNGGVLCQNGNAALFFQVARVHNANNGLLVFAVDTALLQKTVYQCRFTVVNVRDDRHVSQIFSDHFSNSPYSSKNFRN